MNQNRLTLRVDGAVAPSTDLDATLKAIEPVLDRPSFVALELRKGIAPKKWERMLYPLLGLKVPEDITSLSLYSDGRSVFVSFEEKESEWTVKLSSAVGRDKVRLKTEAGEPFEVDASECVLKAVSLQLVGEFYTTEKKPTSVRWVKRT